MSGFPYTDDDIEDFREGLSLPPTGTANIIARMYLQALHKAGITVTFPTVPVPRFVVESTDKSIDVFDRLHGATRLRFYPDNYPGAREAAQAEADRMNAEVSA